MLTILAEHWLSDIKFYHEEIGFLKKLTSKYAIWLTEDANVEKTYGVLKQLADLEQLIKSTDEFLTNHLRLAARIERNPTPDDSRRFVAEHISLEEQIANVTNLFRNVKRMTFSITEA
ncbi:MAG TPA: hypothetical protein VG737_14465, partial [Cyclobacteriaceae bacterium]|nr:hypothetical protein [Cyclobacteriaceae bacterium]